MLKHELWRHNKLYHNNETKESSRNNKKKRIHLTSKEDNNLSNKKKKTLRTIYQNVILSSPMKQIRTTPYHVLNKIPSNRTQYQ